MHATTDYTSGMESEPMLTPREKSPLPGGSEEGQTCDAAQHSTNWAIPAHSVVQHALRGNPPREAKERETLKYEMIHKSRRAADGPFMGTDTDIIP